jgi:hypothetical protein
MTAEAAICLFFAAGGLDCRTHFEPGCRCMRQLAHQQPLWIGGSAMTKATVSRRRTRKRLVREEAIIDHLVRIVCSKADQKGVTHPPVTASGLSVEEQVRKEWQPGPGGLAMF